MENPKDQKEEGGVKTWQLVVAGIGFFIAGNARACGTIMNHALDHPFEDKKQEEKAPTQPKQLPLWEQVNEETRKAIEENFTPPRL